MKKRVWKEWADSLKKDTYALYLVSRDPRVSPLAKVMIGAVVAYALSPIDLIPDFIPIIGYLDDLLILPLGIWIAVRLVPRDVWAECRAMAAERMSELPTSRGAAAMIVIIWLLTTILAALWIGSLISSANNT